MYRQPSPSESQPLGGGGETAGPEGERQARPIQWGQERPKEDKTEGGRWEEKMTKLEGKKNGRPALASRTT